MARGPGRRARAASSCLWSMTRGFGSGDRNWLSGVGSRVRGWYWFGLGAVVAVLGLGFELFVEAAAAVLVEAGVAAGALVSLVA